MFDGGSSYGFLLSSLRIQKAEEKFQLINDFRRKLKMY